MNRLLPKSPEPAPQETLPGIATNALASAILPVSMVEKAYDSIQHSTLRHSGIIRERMQSLGIQPRPFSFDPPNVAVYSTDIHSHTAPDCILNTLMMSAAHSAALDLHNLACTVEPVTPLFGASERFGIAFFAQVRENAGAAVRLRDTLEIVAAEVGARSLGFVPERPWIELVHQMIGPFPSPLDDTVLLPVELFRIRYRGLDWPQMESLLADALHSLPPVTARDGRKDVFTLTLSGHS